MFYFSLCLPPPCQNSFLSRQARTGDLGLCGLAVRTPGQGTKVLLPAAVHGCCLLQAIDHCYVRPKSWWPSAGKWWNQCQKQIGDFPGGPVVKTLPSNAGGMDLIPGWGAKIPHASQPKKKKKNQNIKQKWYCNKFNQDFKNGPHQKNL